MKQWIETLAALVAGIILAIVMVGCGGDAPSQGEDPEDADSDDEMEQIEEDLEVDPEEG